MLQSAGSDRVGGDRSDLAGTHTHINYLSWNLRVLLLLLFNRCRVRLSVTPRTAVRQVPLSFTVSQSLLKFMSVELVMLSNRLILCHPLLLPSIIPVSVSFSSESALHIRWPKYWSFSHSHIPVNIWG